MIYKVMEGSLEKSLERLRVGKCEGSGPNTCISYIFLGFRERSMSYVMTHESRHVSFLLARKRR